MNFVLAIIRGFSQVFFQENIILGIFIILGILFASPTALILAVVGNISSYFISNLIGVQKNLIEIGVYGFNGVLIGTMISFYIKDFPIALIVTIIASAIASIIFYILFKNQIPPFAFPFVITAWTIVILIKIFKLG